VKFNVIDILKSACKLYDFFNVKMHHYVHCASIYGVFLRQISYRPEYECRNFVSRIKKTDCAKVVMILKRSSLNLYSLCIIFGMGTKLVTGVEQGTANLPNTNITFYLHDTVWFHAVPNPATLAVTSLCV
jgi:hypothetical protein